MKNRIKRFREEYAAEIDGFLVGAGVSMTVAALMAMRVINDRPIVDVDMWTTEDKKHAKIVAHLRSGHTQTFYKTAPKES